MLFEELIVSTLLKPNYLVEALRRGLIFVLVKAKGVIFINFAAVGHVDVHIAFTFSELNDLLMDWALYFIEINIFF